MRITPAVALFIPFLAGGGYAIAGAAVTDTITDPILSAPVDVVRDEHGILHIYGEGPGDVAFAGGNVMAGIAWCKWISCGARRLARRASCSA
jgi:acyl-homoserine lactone acylase PvdQ